MKVIYILAVMFNMPIPNFPDTAILEFSDLNYCQRVVNEIKNMEKAIIIRNCEKVLR